MAAPRSSARELLLAVRARTQLAPASEVSVERERVVDGEVLLGVRARHHPGLLVLRDAPLEEVGLALQRDQLHPVERVRRIVQLRRAQLHDEPIGAKFYIVLTVVPFGVGRLGLAYEMFYGSAVLQYVCIVKFHVAASHSVILYALAITVTFYGKCKNLHTNTAL